MACSATVVSPVDQMLVPSMETIRATVDALKNSAEEISASGKSVMETCHMVSNGLSALGISGGQPQGFSLGALPIAMKALVATASKYVEQKTGVSLKQWADFVNTAGTQFEDYLAQLGKVADLARRNEAISGAKILSEQLQKDKKIIEDTRFKTRLWRPIMGRLPLLSQVIDSILESKPKPLPEAEPPDEKGGWGKRLTGAVKAAKDQIADEQDDLLRPLLAPIHEIRDRITQLGGQVEKLSDHISELEDLLDLELAQIQVLLGEIPAGEAEILGQRVGITVLIPRLKKRLTAAQQSAAEYRGFLEKLDVACRQSGVSEKVYAALAAEYQAGLNSAAATASALQEEINLWRARAPGIVGANRNWLKEEQETVIAREMVGQLPSDQARERLARVRRELSRTEKASWLVARVHAGS